MKEKLIDYFTSKEEVQLIIDVFARENIEICFVGGCVRDVLAGMQNHDIDFAINCIPDVTISTLEKNNIKFEDYGKMYGSIVAIINNKKFEITSLREDINQKGRNTEVKFTDDWHKDALRRDFTMNAIYLTPIGKIYDYFGGQKDLLNQQIRFIGNIEKSIKEDYLRIFRFYRFLGLFEDLNILDSYESVFYKYIHEIKKNLTNETMRIEILKMLKNQYKINSFRDFHNPSLKNNLIKQINEWWIEDNYELGIKKCINEVDKYFMNK